MVKLCASFNFQLEKCLAPPSAHLEKCLTPPANAEMGYAILIAWSLTTLVIDTRRIEHGTYLSKAKISLPRFLVGVWI